MHRALRTGGTLVLSEPHRLDLSTPGGVLYVARRAVREAGRALGRALRLPLAPPTATARRAAPGALAAVLDALRYADVGITFERRGGWAAAMPGRFAPRVLVRARTRPSVAGIADAWPDADVHRRAYARAQAPLLAARERFVAAHAPRAAADPVLLDPAAYAGRSVIVLAPHPDDEVIGAGGTLLSLVRAGARVVVVQATDGAAGASLGDLPAAERREVRLREAAAVAQAMGVAAIEFWRADNHRFRATPDLVARLAELLARERPALVLVPFVTDAHVDHRTLARILARAIEQRPEAGDALVLGYEVWSLVPPTHVHDVTALMPSIEALLFRYDRAMRVDDFVHFCADRALVHALDLRGAPAYLEAFHGVAARDFPALARAMPADHGD